MSDKKEAEVFRDQRDIELIRRMAVAIVALSAMAAVFAVIAAIALFRKPNTYVMIKEQGTNRVVGVNDTELNCHELVELGEDRLTNADKAYLAKVFTEKLYGVYLPSREADLKQFLALIADKSEREKAYKLLQTQYKQETERQENSTWQIMRIEVDEANPLVVRVLGEQSSTYRTGERFATRVRQILVTLQLSTDGTRTDESLRTGFMVRGYREEIISEKEI